MLKAEQLRAYRAHIAVHGKIFTQAHPAAPLSARARATSSCPKSRSPSLSCSTRSRPSSPEVDTVATPEEEERKQPRIASLTQSKRPDLPSQGLTTVLKRKRVLDQQAAHESQEDDQRHPQHRQHQPRLLPGISSFIVADTAPRRSSPPCSDRQSYAPLPSNPYTSIYEETLPFNSTRVATSDVRSSASEGDEDER